MSRIVFCQRLKKEAPGMAFQLVPGELGKRIFDNISVAAHQANSRKHFCQDKEFVRIIRLHAKMLKKALTEQAVNAGIHG